jgi:hypothetical protein
MGSPHPFGINLGMHFSYNLFYDNSARNEMHDSENAMALFKAMERQRQREPEMHGKWKTPAIYERGQPLWHHIDAIMHLCFLGIVKSCVALFALHLKLRNRHPSFLKVVQGRLEQIDNSHLNWCKVTPHKKGKLGGWASENCVGFGEVVKWFHSDLPDIAETFECIEPDAPMQTWLKDDLEGWLRIRGQPVSGKKAELLQRINDLLSDPEGPPPILTIVGLDEEDVNRVGNALAALLARVMVNTVTPGQTAKDLDLAIKVICSPALLPHH